MGDIDDQLDDDLDSYDEDRDPDRDDGRLRDRCVLGDGCCCPHPYHGPDECFTAEMAEAFMGELGAGDA